MEWSAAIRRLESLEPQRVLDAAADQALAAKDALDLALVWRLLPFDFSRNWPKLKAPESPSQMVTSPAAPFRRIITWSGGEVNILWMLAPDPSVAPICLGAGVGADGIGWGPKEVKVTSGFYTLGTDAFGLGPSGLAGAGAGVWRYEGAGGCIRCIDSFVHLASSWVGASGAWCSVEVSTAGHDTSPFFVSVALSIARLMTAGKRYLPMETTAIRHPHGGIEVLRDGHEWNLNPESMYCGARRRTHPKPSGGAIALKSPWGTDLSVRIDAGTLCITSGSFNYAGVTSVLIPRRLGLRALPWSLLGFLTLGLPLILLLVAVSLDLAKR